MHSEAAHECDHDGDNYNYLQGHGDNDYHEAFLVVYHTTPKVANSYSQAVRPTSLAQQRR